MQVPVCVWVDRGFFFWLLAKLVSTCYNQQKKIKDDSFICVGMNILDNCSRHSTKKEKKTPKLYEKMY